MIVTRNEITPARAPALQGRSVLCSAGAPAGVWLPGRRGSSDANLTAAAGTPTVDDLGPIGEGSHQKNESIVIDALPARLALFTKLVASLANPIEANS